jgi:imidazolonepropionase-like amidohydrolase
VPTLTVAARWLEDATAVPPSARDRVAALSTGMQQAVRLAVQYGITMGSGADLIGPVQQGRGDEIVHKAALIGAMDAIISATRTNAAILGWGDRLGTVEVGKVADLIAVDGDPLADPSVLADPRRIVLVMQDGRIVKDTR